MRVSSLLFVLANIAIYVFLLLPVFIVIVISFSGTDSVAFPPTSFSLKWFVKFLGERQLVSALLTSCGLATASSAISLVLGGIAAFAIARGTFRGRTAVMSFLMTPLMVPALVIAMAFLEFFALIGTPSFLGLLLGHVIITLPYVVRTMVAGLSSSDMLAEQAAVSLGCTRVQAIRLVTIPMLTNSMVASVLFSFIISFENLPLALFLSDPYTVTLPMQIYNYLQWVFDPTVAAASTINFLVVILLVFIAERSIGLSRFMGVMK
jgi:putative spermidine/putrescine transport system permease protein